MSDHPDLDAAGEKPASIPDAAATPAAGSLPATPATPSSFARNSTFNQGPNVGPGRPMRRQEGPRRLKNGIRLRRREGIDLLAWPADAWSLLLLEGISDGVKTEGLDYARAGQTASLQITPAGVEASVQGRQPRPYTVRIAPEVLAPADWDRVVAIMAREAVYSAKLLAGEMPPLVEQPFVSLGRHLVPIDASTVKRSCTCDLPAPCKHVACVAALLIERLAGDPLLAFTLRGLDGQRLLERRQEARAIATRGGARPLHAPCSGCGSGSAAARPLPRGLLATGPADRRDAERDRAVRATRAAPSPRPNAAPGQVPARRPARVDLRLDRRARPQAARRGLSDEG